MRVLRLVLNGVNRHGISAVSRVNALDGLEEIQAHRRDLEVALTVFGGAPRLDPSNPNPGQPRD